MSLSQLPVCKCDEIDGEAWTCRHYARDVKFLVPCRSSEASVDLNESPDFRLLLELRPDYDSRSFASEAIRIWCERIVRIQHLLYMLERLATTFQTELAEGLWSNLPCLRLPKFEPCRSAHGCSYLVLVNSHPNGTLLFDVLQCCFYSRLERKKLL